MAKQKKQREKTPAIFLDRNLGTGRVAEAIRAEGFDVVVHDDHFAQDTPDIQIFRSIGQMQWVFLSHDATITRNVVELEALIAANIHAFFLRIPNPNGRILASASVAALPQIVEIVARRLPPSLSFIDAQGKISQLSGYDQMVERVQDIRNRQHLSGG